MSAPETTPMVAIDATLAKLHAGCESWASETPLARARLVDEVIGDLRRVARPWVRLSLQAKGFPAGGLPEAEEWLFVAGMFRALRMLRTTLLEETRGHVPGEGPAGVARVFPRDSWDGLVYRGITADVIRGEATPGTISGGRVTLVLGAGNASSLGPLDVVHRLFVERCAVVLKPNPVNAYLGPLIERAFAALIRRGCFAVVYGGEAEGRYLSTHPMVVDIHITGSAATYERIVFGDAAPSPAGKRTIANSRPVTAELGNISPVIVVPGQWARQDLELQATQVATWLTANAGFGCLTPRVLVLHREWPQRRAFLAAIAAALGRAPTRKAFYPGAFALHQRFIAAHPAAHQINQAAPGELPWTLVEDLDPAAAEEICFSTEPFFGLCAATSLTAPSVERFIDEAVAFANNRLWGTLCATLLVHPSIARASRAGEAVERGIHDLRYGTVTVNLFAFVAYYLAVAPWGAYPGHTSNDIQSGVGKVQDMLMLRDAQKSIVRGPFRRWPGDPIRIGARRPDRFAKGLAAFEAGPRFDKLPGLFWSAVRG